MKVLVHFSCTQTLEAFRLAELTTVAEMLRLTITVLDSPNNDTEHDSNTEQPGSSFAVIEVDNDAAVHAMAERCVLARGWYQMFASGSSVDDVVEQLTSLSTESLESSTTEASSPHNAWRSMTAETVSFRYQIETVGKKYSESDKRGIISKFASVGHRGPVSISSPQRVFTVFCQHAVVPTAVHATQHEKSQGALQAVYHGTLIVEGSRSALLEKYSLKSRPYIGTTSMVPELTFMMTNFGWVRKNDLVYDPFCGTGSSLVSAAHWGAKVLGTDMDGRTLKCGSAKVSEQIRQQQAIAFEATEAYWMKHVPDGEEGAGARRPVFSEEDRQHPSMLTNFVAYQLHTSPERVRMNFSRFDCVFAPIAKTNGAACFRMEGFLDAILSDPPYGVREQKKKIDVEQLTSRSGPQCEASYSISGSSTADHYDISDMLTDLVIFAAQSLVVGGRLVFWLPSTYRYHPDEVPSHPCLERVHDLGQHVTLKMVRRLIVMVKRQSLADVTVQRNGATVTRAECFPKRRTEDIRAMLDCVNLPDHEAYSHYREKLAKKRSATHEWKRPRTTEAGGRDAASAAEASSSPTPTPTAAKLSKSERQLQQVANRARNVEERLRKHIENSQEQKSCKISGPAPDEEGV